MRFKEFMEFVFKLSRTVRLAKDEHDVITGKSRCNIHKHQYSFELYNEYGVEVPGLREFIEKEGLTEILEEAKPMFKTLYYYCNS